MSTLTPERLAAFRRDGWTTIPDFFAADEVALLQAEIARLQAVGALRNVATDGDGRTTSKTAYNLQVCPVTPVSPLFAALKHRAKVVDTVRTLVGDPLLFRLDQVFLKPARHGAGTRWHQDNAYWHQPDPVRGVGMWIAVHAAHRANGCMHVVSGSHRRMEDHERDPGSDHHIHVPHVRDEDATPVELPAGGILLFNFGVLHCTTGNRTDHDRAGLALHFINRDATTAEFRADPNVVDLTDVGGRRLGLDGDAAWSRAAAGLRPALAVANPAG